MCGIVGILAADSARYVDALTRRIAHRGPDATGTYTFKNLSIGHQRLSILDLSEGANQPMFSADGRYVIVFNGEVYNHLEIRQTLQGKCHFRTTSDTETILYALIEEGEGAIERFNGIFAFAFLDTLTGDLTLARDHFGVKPLYYYRKDDVFLFGSEIKSFLEYPRFDRSVDYRAFVNYINFLYSPLERTPFAHVKKLLPAHLMRVNVDAPQNLTIRRYYQIPFTGTYSGASEPELLEQFEHTFFAAVRRQLLSDVPVGYFLSGGLDSSAIVTASRAVHAGDRLKCFTIDPGEALGREGFANDLDYAQKVARILECDLEIVQADINIVRDFDKMIYHLDEPQADPAPLNVLNICQRARGLSYKVLLGGTAGDDLFSGYRRHQALRFEKYFGSMPAAVFRAGRWFTEWMGTERPTWRRLNKLLRDADKPRLERLSGYFSWLPLSTNLGLFSADVRQAIGDYVPNNLLVGLLRDIPHERSPLNQMLYWELNTFLVDHNLNYTDKMSMAVGVEARVPFLDKELVEFSTRVPPCLKMKGDTTKYIFKKAMERYLPRDVIYRPKSGFGAPVRDWITRDLKPMIEEYLGESSIRRRGVFDPAAVRQLIDRNQRDRIDASYPIWALLAIESWYRQFVDG